MRNELTKCKQQFRQILGALPCGYVFGEVLVNGNGEPTDYTVLDINHAFIEIASSSKEKVKGKRITGLFSHSSIKDDIAVFCGVAITGDPVEMEFFSPRFDRHFRLFCFSPGNGSFVALFTDLSKEKKLESSLEFVKEFGNTSSDEFYVLDSTGSFISGNCTVAKRLGVPQEKVLGLHFSALNSMADDEWWNVLWKSLLQRGSLQFETDQRDSSNAVYPVELSIDLMDHKGRKYAAVVAKNISTKRTLSKALRQDRRFAEKAASMAGYFVWMLDGEGVFRPLLGGDSGFVSGPAADVFFSLVHVDDRDSFAKAVNFESEGTREFRMKTLRGAVYHRSRWSKIENNCVVGICYPLSGGGLAGMGSESVVMDALGLVAESLLTRMNFLRDALEEENNGVARRITRALIADLSTISGKPDSPQKVRFDAFLFENEGMLKQLLSPHIPVGVDHSQRSMGLVDSTSLENMIVRLLLVVKSTEKAASITIRSMCDSFSSGIVITIDGNEGIQTELEKLFIPLKNTTPALSSVYSMVRSGGGRVFYETLNDKVEFTLSFPKTGMDDNAAQTLIVLPDRVDAARSHAALKSAGFSAAIETTYSEVLRRVNEDETRILIMSPSMLEFSIDDVMSCVSNVVLIQIGGEPLSNRTKYLSDGFRTSDLIAAVSEVNARVEMLQAEALPDGNLWGEPLLKPPLL